MEKSLKTRKIIDLIIFIFLIVLITFSYKLLNIINILAFKLIANCFINILLGFIAFLFIKKSKMKIDYGFKNKKAYLIGIIIAVALEILLGVLPILFGQSLIGGKSEFVLWSFIYQFFYFVLIIGPVEELIFRVYIQDTVLDLLSKNKWIAVIISSVLFGFFHLINGNIIQVVFTTIIGLILGFAKYKIKDCKYSSLALGHGLYDFLNVVSCTFLII